MNTGSRPRRLLMASDLSARCDRALSRAAQLARHWRSGLTVVHVASAADLARSDRLAGSAPSWRRPEPRLRMLARALQADLDHEGIEATAQVLTGPTADALLQATVETSAGLLVMGIAKAARSDRHPVGLTAEALVRQSTVPVLSVRHRTRGPYRHVVVASDFSLPALHALRLAALWFDDARLTLFHAYTPPGTVPVAGTDGGAPWHAAIERQCEAHLAEAALAPALASGLERRLEAGEPEDLLWDFVNATDADLVVLGSHGRGGWARALLGSTAEHLLHVLDCDTLVVRG